MSSPVLVRVGRLGDRAAVLALWDQAIAWLVEREQSGQWGTEPASARNRNRKMVGEWEAGTGLRVVELDGEPVGASVMVGVSPVYVPPTTRRESYLLFLIADRAHARRGIGSELVRRAANEARAAGSELLRVDCWAGAGELVAWYERQGFVRSDSFTVGDGWPGQVFEMPL